ncbi:glycosyltransferase [Corynebacterium choanae]|uniref:Hyaluronan synthase n=1 Tax=Corynebacterium choanae TaxID=1862358 RepID=A0A3G6J568_9CORY|nr:glycosyltransferase [Corynebacterium choanae]AZA13235.1 Hyaluronan synthase [Corynebacterium choanae]
MPKQSQPVDISVVIGFKDWGEQRLRLAVESILASFGELNGEVIVSDYGSTSGSVRKEVLEAAGATYIYTETDGTWSRSRALNAGFAVARGEVLCSTDADMIFSPGSFSFIGNTLKQRPNSCLLVQCRDLPQHWDDSAVAEQGFQWEAFAKESRLRPRWGMGGMMAVHRDVYNRIRGLDERMHTYGGEDIDFVTRARRAGCALLWIEDPTVRMYHMWHPSTAAVMDQSEASRLAVENNKSIMRNDKTFVRNLRIWRHPSPTAPPLVSVAIATQDRAELLRECIQSVLAQSVQDFEIIVVDDGSTDHTQAVVSSFNDERIHYIYQEAQGVAVARNTATRYCTGSYIAVQDDDDLMTPWRLESQLAVIEQGYHGSFGAFANFDNETGDLHIIRSRALAPHTIADNGGAPGHGTWLVDRRALEIVQYDELLDSGIDNNVALRLTRAGFKLKHCGEIVMLRRMHGGQITVTNEQHQKTAARQTRAMYEFAIENADREKLAGQVGGSDWTPVRLADEPNKLLPYLPDHLVRRRVNNALLQISRENVNNFPDDVLIIERGKDTFVLHEQSELRFAELAPYTQAGLFDSLSAVLEPRAFEATSAVTAAEETTLLDHAMQANGDELECTRVDSYRLLDQSEQSHGNVSTDEVANYVRTTLLHHVEQTVHRNTTHGLLVTFAADPQWEVALKNEELGKPGAPVIVDEVIGYQAKHRELGVKLVTASGTRLGDILAAVNLPATAILLMTSDTPKAMFDTTMKVQEFTEAV